MTDSTRGSRRSGRCSVPIGGGGTAETWKRHIVRQLKHRDRNQHDMFQDLIRFCKEELDLFGSKKKGFSLGAVSDQNQEDVCTRYLKGFKPSSSTITCSLFRLSNQCSSSSVQFGSSVSLFGIINFLRRHAATSRSNRFRCSIRCSVCYMSCFSNICPETY